VRDVGLLSKTLRVIRDDGGDVAIRHVVAGRCEWRAGATALNGQAINDLIEDGWLRAAADRSSARIDAFPNFARRAAAS
jgi:hypothetical protein